MGKNPKLGTFSCKFLYDDNRTSIFQIPSQLVKIYGDDLAQTATVRISNSQKCWKVSVEKLKGQHFFTDGWKEFAEEVDMKTGEYLLFRAAGLCSFHISPFESNNEKELSSGGYTENSEDGCSLTDAEIGPCVGKSFTFTAELASWHKQKLGLPRKFIERAGLKIDNGLILQNVEGRQWPVRLTRSCCRYALTDGWADFLIANKLTVGSMMSMKFVSGSNKTIEARVIKQGTELFNLVKRNGNKFEVFESDKIGDVARGAENSHKASEVGESPGNSHKTSEPAKGLENLYGMREHTEGPENLHVRSQHTEEPEDIDKTSDIAKGPENTHTPSGHGETTNLHQTSGQAEGPEANVKAENQDHSPDEENEFGVERSWGFSKKLKTHNAYKLNIPRCFSKVVEKTTKEEIKLLDHKGRKWPVRLEYRKCGAYTMTSGWIDFLVGNKVYVGSTISFDFTPSRDSNVLEARVMENGRKGTELFVKKAKGRPPCRTFHTTSGHVEGPQKSYGNVKSGNKDHLPEKEVDCGVERRWTFSKKLKIHDAYKLDIPRGVSKVVEKATTGEIKLQDCKGRKWPVRLAYRKCGAYTMTSGWIDFLVGNKVHVGSTVSFEFIPSKDRNVMGARVITEIGRKGTEPFIKRAKGRPLGH